MGLVIENLSAAQVKQILTAAKETNVIVNIRKDLARITISGFRNDDQLTKSVTYISFYTGLNMYYNKAKSSKFIAQYQLTEKD